MTEKISRRDFLRLGAAGAATSVLAGCTSPRRWVVLEPFVRPPEQQVSGLATWYATTCRQCPAGCGVIVRLMNGRAVKLEGNPEHPLNRGKLCARGQAGLQMLYHPDRLSGPLLQATRGSREFAAIDWNEGINRLFQSLEKAGSAVAVLGGATMSDHLYDLFTRFLSAMNAPAPVIYDLYTELGGYLSLSQAMARVYGRRALPAYPIGAADVVFSFGAEFLGTWTSAVRYGVEFGAFRSQPYGKRGMLAHFEPRQSSTAVPADRYFSVAPGSEGLVAGILLRLIADGGLGLPGRADRARSMAPVLDVDQAARECEIPIDELRSLARRFAEAEHPVAIPGGALAGSSNGMQAAMAIEALNVVAGYTPQGIALPDASVALPHKPLNSFEDVKSLIARMRAGEVQVLLVHSTNPAYELPQSAGFLEALANVPLVVSFASMVDETAVWSDLILPDRSYLESWGYEVVTPDFGSSVISGQQPVVTPVFDARATGDVLLTVARGIPAAAAALPWEDEVDYLSQQIGGLPQAAYPASGPEEARARFQQHGGWWPRAAASASGVGAQPFIASAARAEFEGAEADFPFFLHLYPSVLLSDGRGAPLPLLQGVPDPMTTIAWQSWAEIHPATAEKLQVRDGDLLRITSPYGEVEVPAYVTPGVRPDTVAIPAGQGHDDLGRFARDRGANVVDLLGTAAASEGGGLRWNGVRVALARTGKRIATAALESKVGVTEGLGYE
jgi:anaerobic selenocysteine-containing dehydrogenase